MEWSHWDLMAPSASTSIAARISRLVHDGELAPGDRIPGERELAARLKVSRATVREALRELELRGLISRTPGRGTVIEDIPRPHVHAGLLGTMRASSRVLREVMDLRAVVEPPIAERAASRAGADQVRELRELLEQAEREHADGVRGERYTELDLAFHACLARMTQNPMLERLLAVTHEWMAPSRSPALESDQRIRRSLSAHRAILDAIERSDAHRAREEMDKHIDEILQTITGEHD